MGEEPRGPCFNLPDMLLRGPGPCTSAPAQGVTGAVRPAHAQEQPRGLSGDRRQCCPVGRPRRSAPPAASYGAGWKPPPLRSMVHGAAAWSPDHPRQAAGSWRGHLARAGAASHRASQRAAGRRIVGPVTRRTGDSIKAPGPLSPPPHWDVGLRAGAPVRRHVGLGPSRGVS